MQYSIVNIVLKTAQTMHEKNIARHTIPAFRITPVESAIRRPIQ
jgi:hypothetical protein